MTAIDPIPADVSSTVGRVVHGSDQIVAHPGTSQYATGGVSACGLASLNFARIVFEKERMTDIRPNDEAFLRAMVEFDNVMEIISVCHQWPQELHAEIEDLLKAPIFKQTLKEVTCHFGTPTFDKFNNLLKDLSTVASAARGCAVTVITRPPEIIACARTPQSFVVFDSHPRPKHPTGAGLFLSRNAERTARYLHNLLFVDPTIFAGSGFQWEAQLLSNFSAQIFVSQGPSRLSAPHLTSSLLGCSLELLALRAQVADLETRRRASVESSKQLEEEIERVQIENDVLKEKNDILEDEIKKQKQLSDIRLQERTDAVPVSARPSILPTSSFMASEGCSKLSSLTPVTMVSKYASSLSTTTRKDDKGKQRADDVEQSMNLAWQLQHEFDIETELFSADRKLVESSVQPTFECTICMDTLLTDYAAYISGCKHTTCRDCLRQHIITTLHDHRYPVFCPACVGDAPKAEITQEVLFDIGIPEKEYSIYEESQLSILSILIHCRKCKEGVFVDRAEYNDAKILACPLPNCTHAWCKSCHQTIEPGVVGPPHSCDGSSELQHLMNKQGWKHCPGCKTPVAKDSGCNHMTCMSPGCNTHFCYICGEAIIRSALRGDIRNAVSSHYRRCTLFAVPRDTL